MRSRQDPYIRTGAGLLLAGGLLLPVGYLVLHSAPYGALGMSLIILGAICLALARARPPIPPEFGRILLETGLENTGALVEELGLRSRAVYLPSSLTAGPPQALIPLHSNGTMPNIAHALPKRLVARYGPGAEDLGLLVTTPGSRALAALPYPPGASPQEAEAALSAILVGMADLATGVRVSQSGPTVNVTVFGTHLSYAHGHAWLHQCLGSPIASIVATVMAEAMGSPLAVEAEEVKGSRHTITLAMVK